MALIDIADAENGRRNRDMVPEAGQRFGPYEILGRLGSGAMGLVFRAWDARLHREVAIKLLHSDYDMPGMRERFLQEARAASALNHPHICTIFDLGEQDGEPYMVMELLEGETLKEKISRGALPVDEIISHAQEVADALAAAHAKGIVHRDVKPANIFLVDQANGRKQAKVLDFGLAKIGLALKGGRASRALDLTLAGATVGTLSYMSPEQARGQTLDERSDLFSLGVVMYEMATRQVPFQGATSALIFVQLLNHAPESLHEWNDTIPKELEKIILKLLSKDRESRYQSATELAQALRKIPFRSGGGWLKRAAAAVPLVKAQDPVARGKRPLRPASDQGRPIRGMGKPTPPAPRDSPVAAPAQLAGAQAAGAQTTGAQTAGAQTTGAQTAGAQTTGAQTTGAQTTGAQTTGAQTTGTQAAGAQTTGVTAVPAPARTLSSPDSTFFRPVARSPYRSDGSRDEGILRGDRTGSGQSPAAAKAVSDSTPAQAAAERTIVSATDASAHPLPDDAVQSPAPLVEKKADAVLESSRSEASLFESGSAVSDPSFKQLSPRPVAARTEVARPEGRRPEAATGTAPLSAKSPASEKDEAKRAGMRTAIAAGMLAVLVGGAFLLMNTGRFRPVLLKQGEPLLLTVIQNRTEDKSLNGSVMEGLELVLEQSQYLTVRGGEAYRAGLKQVEAEGSVGGSVSSRRIAQIVGAKAYLYGEIKGSGPYTIGVDVLSTDSNDKLTSLEEKAESKEQIVTAIGRLAARVRADMGESERSVARSNKPLDKEATAAVQALQSFALGESALQTGRNTDAIAAFEQAKVADPKFTQAHLRLAWLYRAEHAETAAATEAKLAQDASEGGSDRLRLLAQLCHEMNATGDYTKAAGIVKQYRELYPLDDAGLLSLARVLRAQGHIPEALQAAQQAYSDDPYNGDAYAEAVPALIALDRYTGAQQLQEQAARLGVTRKGSSLAALYLAGDKDALAKETSSFRTADAAGHELLTRELLARESLGRAAHYGLSLDTDGRLTAGAAFWKVAAASAGSSSGQTAELAAAQPNLLAQAALDRALARSCGPALDFARDASRSALGLVASFNTGMAFALCGDKGGAVATIEQLKQRYPQSTAVTGYYVADLQAALGLNQKDAKAALTALGQAAAYDTVSLTPYLRGLAHLETAEAALAVADFQTVVDHPGAAFMAGSNVYPMAQLGLARAYAAIGDKANSASAYRRFAALWHDADRGQGMLEEAVARGR